MYAKDQSAIMTFATQNTKANLSTTLLSCLFVLVCLYFCLYFFINNVCHCTETEPILSLTFQNEKEKNGKKKKRNLVLPLDGTEVETNLLLTFRISENRSPSPLLRARGCR